MTTKNRPNAFENPYFTQVLEGFDTSAITSIQQRNMEAVSRAARMLSETTAKVAKLQMEMLSGFSSMKRDYAAFSGQPEEVTEAVHSEYRNTRSALETTIERGREISDTLRNCFYDVAEELELCGEENWRCLRNGVQGEAQAKSAARGKAASAKPSTDTPAPVTPRAVSN